MASRLWADGVSAEYLPHSGIMLSLLKRLRQESVANETPGSSDWSLSELFGVCALLNIRFLVIVQPHLLKDKGCVRLRRYPFDTISQGPNAGSSSNNEIVVPLEDLASTIQGDSSLLEEDADEPVEMTAAATSSSSREYRTNKDTQVECIYIDHDQYFGNDRDVSKNETPHWKSYMKTMKGISLSAESYLSSLQDSKSQAAAGMQGLPVFAADIPFLVLRDFGTALMRREGNEKSAIGASNEILGNSHTSAELFFVVPHPSRSRLTHLASPLVETYE